jgi:hypothetical protein
MTAENRARFAELLALLSEAFNEPVSEARAAAYWLALEDVDIRWIEHAIRTSLREAEFFPRPARLRRWAAAAEREQQRHHAEAAARARVLVEALGTVAQLQIEQERLRRLTPAEREAEAARARAEQERLAEVARRHHVQDLAWWKAHWAAEDARTGRWRTRRASEEG